MSQNNNLQNALKLMITSSIVLIFETINVTRKIASKKYPNHCTSTSLLFITNTLFLLEQQIITYANNHINKNAGSNYIIIPSPALIVLVFATIFPEYSRLYEQ